MSSTKPTPCPTCGAALPAFAPQGNCPVCLLRGSSGAEKSDARPAGDRMPEVPGFRLTEELGEGGFGLVYRAEQLGAVRREVAIKLLKPGMDSEQTLARFEAERQALAMMDHPNIATIYEAGETEDGRPYFAMELVNGAPLNHFCARAELSLERRLEVFLQACDAVAHAHRKGLIHRDLKPSNILVGETLKVIDFGIAKATEQLLTERTLFTAEAQLLGTPEYMSPEQAAGGGLGIDTRTDVYSLGALLYELITGAPPFRSADLEERGFAEILRVIREDDPARPSTRLSTARAGVPIPTVATPKHVRGELDWIVMTALEKDRARRYGSVDALAEDVRRYLDDEPVRARPPSAGYRIGKFVRKHRAAVAAAAAVVVAILAGGAFSALMAVRAESARVGEESERRRADAAALETSRAFSRSDFMIAGKLTDDGRDADAVAHLARALRSDPSNSAASFKLLATLAGTSFPQPAAPTVRLDEREVFSDFHPDGERLVTVSGSGLASLWRQEEGAWVTTEMMPSRRGYTTSAMDAAGRRLAVGSQWGGIEVFDLESGKKIAGPFPHEGKNVRDVAISRDGKFAFSVGHDNHLRAIDVDANREAWKFHYRSAEAKDEKDGAGRAAAVGVSPDGTLVACGHGDGVVNVLDAATGEKIASHDCHDGVVFRIVFLPRGVPRFATASFDGTACVWDARTGEQVSERLIHDAPVYAIAASPCGARIATASYDNTARVWNSRTGQPVTRPLLHTDHVYSVAFSPDSVRLATGSRDRTVRLWEVETGVAASAPILLAHSATKVAFSPDGARLLTGTRNRDVRVWDVRTRTARPLAVKHRSAVYFVGFDQGDASFAAWEPRGYASEWRTSDGEPVGSPIRLPGNPGKMQFTRQNDGFIDAFEIGKARSFAKRGMLLMLKSRGMKGATCLAMDKDGETLLAGYTDGRVTTWKWEKAKKLSDFKAGDDLVACIDIATGSDLAIAGFKNGTARLLRPASGEVFGATMKHDRRVTCVVLSPDGTRAATGSLDNTVRLWDTSSGEPICPPLLHEDLASAAGLFCKFSPDGKILASAGSHDGTLRLWDTETGEQVGAPFKHGNVVTAFRFSPDGRRLVSAGTPHDGVSEVHVWDLASGEPLAPPQRLRQQIHWVSFSHDGRRVAIAGSDGTVRIWDQPPPQEHTPGWVPDLAEALVGRRLAEGGTFQPVAPDAVLDLDRRLGSLDGDPELKAWARWLLNDPTERTISPLSELVSSGWLGRIAESGTTTELREALLVDPMRRSLLRKLAERIGERTPNTLREVFYREAAQSDQ